jgi:hypothetical protein
MVRPAPSRGRVPVRVVGAGGGNRAETRKPARGGLPAIVNVGYSVQLAAARETEAGESEAEKHGQSQYRTVQGGRNRIARLGVRGESSHHGASVGARIERQPELYGDNSL